MGAGETRPGSGLVGAEWRTDYGGGCSSTPGTKSQIAANLNGDRPGQAERSTSRSRARLSRADTALTFCRLGNRVQGFRIPPVSSPESSRNAHLPTTPEPSSQGASRSTLAGDKGRKTLLTALTFAYQIFFQMLFTRCVYCGYLTLLQ